MRNFIEKILFGILGVLVAITLFIVLCANTPGLSQAVGNFMVPLVQSLNPPETEENAPVEAAAAQESTDTSVDPAQQTVLSEDTTNIKLEENLNDNGVEVKKADE